jgi:hypothetical protein
MAAQCLVELMFGVSIMKKTIVTTFLVLGIVFTSYLFAAAVGLKISPTAINLSADGVDVVTIHTLIPGNDDICKNASVQLVDNAGSEFLFEGDDLDLQTDNQGHLVIRIEAWTDLLNEDVAVGEAWFTPEVTCDGVKYDQLEIKATIINVGEQDED